MRSAKSLISGFGVAASLIGAVASAFFITAALVAFHGSFSVSDVYPPQSTLIVASVKHDRPIVIAVAPQPAARPAVSSRVEVPAKPQVLASVPAPTVTFKRPSRGAKSEAVPPVVARPVKPNPTPTPPSATAPLANATAGLTNVVGGVVADATGNLGTTVAPISPALGGTVQGLGTGLANGVVALGNTVAAVVTALGTLPAPPQG